MPIPVAAVVLAQLIALVLWLKPRKLPTPLPRARPAAQELPALLAPLLEEIAQLRRAIHDERLARAAGLAAGRFAAHRAMRIAAESSNPPLIAVETEGDRSAIEMAIPLVARPAPDLDDGEITEAEQTQVQPAPKGHALLSIVGDSPCSPLRRLPTLSPPPVRPLAFPDSLSGSEDVPDEVGPVIKRGSGLGPDDDTPPQGIRAIRVIKPQ